MIHVLVVAQPSTAIDALIEALSLNGCAVEAHRDFNTTAPLNPEHPQWNVVLADDTMQPATDPAMLRIPRIVLATQPSIQSAVAAIKLGASDYLPLPADTDEVMAAIETATIAGEAPGEARAMEFAIIGDSEPMRELKARIQRVAGSDSPVLIHGESGTGKELVARAVHAASSRRNRPLITVNCAAIPDQLLEAELFGQQTDGEAVSRGLADTADGGTLFLDEVGELSPEVQARLLRLLQTGETRPVGSPQAHSVDVRVVAATHRDLASLVAQGQFREDLLFRLNVVYLQLPPLRVRGEDITQIGQWLLEHTSARLNRNVRQFTPQALEAMVSYNWPGNVRELANAVERAVILAQGESIPPELLAIDSAPQRPDATPPEGQDQTSLEDYFVRFVLDNEEHCTETELAEKLGISRKSLWERRQRLNIPRKKTKTRGPRRIDSAETEDRS